ncbi:Ig-like domain-containing protein [Fictibacillus aquaticus]|uniref:Bacterial Ig domain-containing protein n=1 Tax=Fictibacillus aquaticus TaxID=2021314 RepID=A0A235F9F9_9BACL|nr:Ig-like domain-containing protein [Fictibacillus aquaticus]OYD57587.1 hypothetical protein CGZ90_13040 [Fictibacillus aquaticus]
MKKVWMTGLLAGMVAVSGALTATAQSLTKSDADVVVMEVEPNNSMEQATPFLDETFAKGGFTTQGDVDYYEIEVTKNDDDFHIVALPNNEAKFTLVFDLLDAKGNYVKPVDESAEELITKIYDINAGTYYIKANELNGAAYNSMYDFYHFVTIPSEVEWHLPPKVNPVDDNDKRVTGIAPPGERIVVKSGTKELGRTYASRTGGYTVPLKTTVKAGTKLAVMITDEWADDTSRVTNVVVKDGTAPGMPRVNAVDSNDKKVTGSAEANAVITVKVGSKVIATGRANSKGKFIVTVKAQRKGTVLYVAAADKAKNVSKSARVVVKKG